MKYSVFPTFLLPAVWNWVLVIRNLFVPCILYLGISFLLSPPLQASTVTIDTPMTPPTWALLERELLRTQSEAIQLFFERYFDERGYLLCIPRWGGDDGPDDAGQNEPSGSDGGDVEANTPDLPESLEEGVGLEPFEDPQLKKAIEFIESQTFPDQQGSKAA